MNSTSLTFRLRLVAAILLSALLGTQRPAHAQVEMKPTKAAAAAAATGGSTGGTAQIDLAPLDLGGADVDDKPAVTRARPSTSGAEQAEAAKATRRPVVTESRPAPSAAPAADGIERVVFDRRPVRVALPVNRERLITFTQPVALNAPEDIASYMRINIVGKTMYVTALMPFGSVRVFVEQLDGEQLQIPLDLVADRSTAAASGEIQIFGRAETGSRQTAAVATSQLAKANESQAQRPETEEVSVDAVMLTRCAARKLYAPWRLTGCDAAIHQVPLELKPVADLYRGARVQTTPIGAWRAGPLWVTAVRMTNLEAMPLEIRLEDIRGSWITSTAHSGFLGRAGSESDTTALYLVCDRPFEACR